MLVCKKNLHVCIWTFNSRDCIYILLQIYSMKYNMKIYIDMCKYIKYDI